MTAPATVPTSASSSPAGAGSVLVTFRLGVREYAASLVDVLEVVRLQGLADLPGMAPPLAGVLDLRGTAVPVLDLRAGSPADGRGDVLVLDRSDAVGQPRPVGVAVDQVRAVVPAVELPPAGAGAAAGVLPAYVLEVLLGARGVVFLVDLEQMVSAAGALPGSAAPAVDRAVPVRAVQT